MEKMLLFKTLAKMEKYYGKTLDPEVREIYIENLQKLNDNDFKAASVNLMSNFQPTSTKPFPLIADFLSACGQGGDNQAVNVVSVVKRAAERIGQYDSVDFQDPAIHNVIMRYGGWPDIVCWGEREWSMHERNFISAYKAAKSLGNQSSPSHLPGLHEINNSKEGHNVVAPLLISPTTGRTEQIENKKNYQIEDKKPDIDCSNLIKGIE